jgi:hypothetical protein
LAIHTENEICECGDFYFASLLAPEKKPPKSLLFRIFNFPSWQPVLFCWLYIAIKRNLNLRQPKSSFLVLFNSQNLTQILRKFARFFLHGLSGQPKT